MNAGTEDMLVISLTYYSVKKKLISIFSLFVCTEDV